MTVPDWLLDTSLAAALPLVAWRVLTTDDLSKAVVLFIAVGLLSALAWARLGAPDVALVEAAVGASLTGALLMDTLGWFVAPPPAAHPRRAWTWPALAIVLETLLLAWTARALPAGSPGLTEDVVTHLDQSGVSHPVTAVLLNFRGYDTLLEIAVLMVAALAARSIERDAKPDGPLKMAGPMLAPLLRLLLPGVILVAGYLLWQGSHGPGGAFQAAAVLAGGAVMLLLAGYIRGPQPSSLAARAALLLGPTVFLVASSWPLFSGRSLLQYPAAHAGAVILAIESSLTISIAAMLVMLFPRTGEPRRRSEPWPRR